jgi:hypothetical protein
VIGTTAATSTSITITISTRTTLTTTGTTLTTDPGKATGRDKAAVSGSITHNIAVTLPTGTGELPVSTVEERKGNNARVAQPALGIVPVAEPEMPQVIGPAVDQVGDKPIGRAVAKLIGPVVDLAAGKLIGLAVGRLIGPAAAKQIGPAAAAERRVQAVAEIGLGTALYPRVQGAAAATP